MNLPPMRRPFRRSMPERPPNARPRQGLRDFANLDFLASASFISLNLKPDADGKIEVDLKDLAGRTAIYVVAVDPQTVDQRTVYLPAADRQQEDLRLADGLDPQRHFALNKQISLFDADQTVRIESLGSGRFQLYDSLPRVYQLYETLLPESHLKDFRFVLDWHKLQRRREARKVFQICLSRTEFLPVSERSRVLSGRRATLPATTSCTRRSWTSTCWKTT